MARILCGCIAAAVLALGPAAPSKGFWLDSFFDHVHTGYKVNRRWPSPYICPDRAAVRAPFDVMVRNGWRRQNLMGSHHFNSEATELTRSGQLKVRWIMTQAPPQYRQVFVERSLDRSITDQRMSTVRAFTEQVAEQLALDQGPAPVSETQLVSEGRPAATVDYVNTQFRENMRVPELPEVTTTGADQ